MIFIKIFYLWRTLADSQTNKTGKKYDSRLTFVLESNDLNDSMNLKMEEFFSCNGNSLDTAMWRKPTKRKTTKPI